MTRGLIERWFNRVRADASHRLVGLGRYPKRAFLITADIFVLSLTLWLAFSVRYQISYWPDDWRFALLTATVPFLGVAAFAQAGIYRMVTRYIGSHSVYRIASTLLMSILVWALLIFLSGLTGTPRTVMAVYWIFGSSATLLVRLAAARFLNVDDATANSKRLNRVPVLVWGGGPLGMQLAAALERSERYQPYGFVDLSSDLWGQYIGDYRVFRPDRELCAEVGDGLNR